VESKDLLDEARVESKRHFLPEMAILLIFRRRSARLFSKEELLDHDLTQDVIRTLLKSLLPAPRIRWEKRDLGRLILP